jgi:large subunit ribosomal protein L10
MRPEKNLIIDEIKSRVDKTPYVLLTDYTGMQVPQFNELRNRLSGAKAELRVVKNTLLRRALKDSNLPDLESYLHGQSAVVMGDEDVSAAAKVLKNFAAEFQKPKIKVGILDKAVLEPADIMALADLPSKDVLQSKLLGLLMAPASMLVRLINTPASQVAQVLKAYSDKGEPINAPAKEAPQAEAAAEAPQAEAAPEAPKAEAAPAAEPAPAAEAAPSGEAAAA